MVPNLEKQIDLSGPVFKKRESRFSLESADFPIDRSILKSNGPHVVKTLENTWNINVYLDKTDKIKRKFLTAVIFVAKKLETLQKYQMTVSESV